MLAVDVCASTLASVASRTHEAVDPAKGTITLQHQAIEFIHWPAMTMTFKVAKPEVLQMIRCFTWQTAMQARRRSPASRKKEATMTHHTAEHRSQAMNDCILACRQCETACLETINYCLGEGGEHAAPDHISLMEACADIWGTCGRTM